MRIDAPRDLPSNCLWVVALCPLGRQVLAQNRDVELTAVVHDMQTYSEVIHPGVPQQVSWSIVGGSSFHTGAACGRATSVPVGAHAVSCLYFVI